MPGDLPENLTQYNYKKWKNELAEVYIKDCEKSMGFDIMSHIEEISVATPVSFARYLGTPNGEVYGYQNENWDSVINRSQAQFTDFTVPHLHYCGGHSVMGDGFSSAYITGHDTGIRVVNSIKGGK